MRRKKQQHQRIGFTELTGHGTVRCEVRCGLKREFPGWKVIIDLDLPASRRPAAKAFLDHFSKTIYVRLDPTQGQDYIDAVVAWIVDHSRVQGVIQ